MKIDLLPQGVNWYRANFHCHTILSDGKLTPEQVKDLYKSRGYSIVAYSDHERYIPHPDLDDENFLALYALECALHIDRNPLQPPPGLELNWRHFRCYHINLFARHRDVVATPLRKTIWGAQRNQFDGTNAEKADLAKFSYEKVNDFLRVAKEAGFFSQLDHPYWSLNTMEDCLSLENLWSLEILNWGTQRETGAEYCPYIYDQMLWKNGPSLLCTMGDDNHNPPSLPPEEQCFGGSTFIGAKSLDYDSITDAMARGDVFCASGFNPPRFHAMWIEDGKVHVEFSPVNEIIYTGYGRVYRQVRGVGLASATFDLGESDPYFRITLIDGEGNFAHTHAYAIRDEWRVKKQ